MRVSIVNVSRNVFRLLNPTASRRTVNNTCAFLLVLAVLLLILPSILVIAVTVLIRASDLAIFCQMCADFRSYRFAVLEFGMIRNVVRGATHVQPQLRASADCFTGRDHMKLLSCRLCCAAS